MKSLKTLVMIWSRRLALALVAAAVLTAGALAQADEPMEITLCEHHYLDENSSPRLTLLKQMGATSIQSYIYWNEVEKQPGQYDWSAYDKTVAQVRAAGLRWVPFVIAGPWYVTPGHVRASHPDLVYLQCLEHGKPSGIPSIWDESFRPVVDGYLQAFADHFGPMDVLESVNLGICGDYGEAIFPVIGNWPGEYHTHPGLWCGDRLAVQDFQRHLGRLYKNDIQALNDDWGTAYAGFDQVRPFEQKQAPCDKAWLTLVQWYRDAMSAHADWWLACARSHFGATPLYLCTGGDMAPLQGSEFSAQARLAAAHQAGLRITNESSSFPFNFYVTRMVSSACRFYGSYYGNEPASAVDGMGCLGRLFNARAGGARQLFVYAGNVLEGNTPNQGYELLKAHQAFMTRQSPRVELALLYPTSSVVADSNFRPEFYIRLRESIDYDLIDERMIQDGALERYPMLLVYDAKLAQAQTLEKIQRWAEAGGVVFSLNSRLKDWDGDRSRWNALTGLSEEAEETLGHTLGQCLAPEVLPSFKDAVKWTFRTGLRWPAEDCRVLVRMQAERGGANIWMRSQGKGLVFVYHGPADLTTPEGEWNILPPLPLLFMSDAMNYLINEKKIAHVPASLWRSKPPVFLTQYTDGRVEAFNPNGKPMEYASGEDVVNIAPGQIQIISGQP